MNTYAQAQAHICKDVYTNVCIRPSAPSGRSCDILLFCYHPFSRSPVSLLTTACRSTAGGGGGFGNSPLPSSVATLRPQREACDDEDKVNGGDVSLKWGQGRADANGEQDVISGQSPPPPPLMPFPALSRISPATLQSRPQSRTPTALPDHQQGGVALSTSQIIPSGTTKCARGDIDSCVWDVGHA
jgi:hypothetical protein